MARARTVDQKGVAPWDSEHVGVAVKTARQGVFLFEERCLGDGFVVKGDQWL